MDGAADDPSNWLLIDAMNVIGSRPNGWWRDRPGAIRTLISRLRKYVQHHQTAVTVVIDGRPLPDLPEDRPDSVEIRYAHRSGRNAADDRIVELLAERGERATVITADRDLRQRVAAMGSSLIGPDQLLRELDRLDGL